MGMRINAPAAVSAASSAVYTSLRVLFMAVASRAFLCPDDTKNLSTCQLYSLAEKSERTFPPSCLQNLKIKYYILPSDICDRADLSTDYIYKYGSRW